MRTNILVLLLVTFTLHTKVFGQFTGGEGGGYSSASVTVLVNSTESINPLNAILVQNPIQVNHTLALPKQVSQVYWYSVHGQLVAAQKAPPYQAPNRNGLYLLQIKTRENDSFKTVKIVVE